MVLQTKEVVVEVAKIVSPGMLVKVTGTQASNKGVWKEPVGVARMYTMMEMTKVRRFRGGRGRRRQGELSYTSTPTPSPTHTHSDVH